MTMLRRWLQNLSTTPLALRRCFPAATLAVTRSGGVFTPALLIGATFGGGLAALAADFLPGFDIQPEAFALVGMAGLLAGSTHAPLTAITPCISRLPSEPTACVSGFDACIREAVPAYAALAMCSSRLFPRRYASNVNDTPTRSPPFHL